MLNGGIAASQLAGGPVFNAYRNTDQSGTGTLSFVGLAYATYLIGNLVRAA